MSKSRDQPPSGKRASANYLDAIDQHVKDHPDHAWVTVPKFSDLKHGWRDISYAELAHAVDGMARWIDDNAKLDKSSEVVAYMGINDVRYMVVMLALHKAGHKIMLPSPRNSIEGQSNLFKLTECKNLLYSESFDIGLIKQSIPGLKTLQIPGLDDLIQQGAQQGLYQSKCDPDEAATAVVLHTSGSTGLPKPIYLTFGLIATFAAVRDMKPLPGRENMTDVVMFTGKSLFTMLPFFHMAAFIVWSKTFFDVGPLIVMPTGRPVNSETVIEVINQTKPYGAMFAPSVLEDISDSPEGLEALSQIEFITWGGAPLSHDAGERARQHTKLATMIGSTEAGMLPTVRPEKPEDWFYFEWAEGAGIEMDKEADGLYECVIRAGPDRDLRGIFHTFPDITEYHTKDLFAQHPTNPKLWDYQGRKDDVLVLSNGEKVQPVTFEKMVEDHPLIKGALVVGEGRFQTALVIEPIWEKLRKHNDPEKLVEQVWSTVEKANENLPAHGQVWRSKIAVTKPGKPFVRAPKGSIMRRATVKAYESEIDALYSHEGLEGEVEKLDDNADLDTIKSTVYHIISLVCPGFSTDTSDDTDFFSVGVDSLQVLGLVTAVNHACFDGRETHLGPKDIYGHPTVDALSDYILHARDGGREGGQAGSKSGPKREEVLLKMIDKYTHDLPKRDLPSNPTTHESHVVVLTGSTGGLGNLILEELIALPKVSKIYCLNRSSDAQKRQKQAFESRDVTPDFEKVTFLHTDFSQDHFGLPDSSYDELLSTVTIFLHNAWAVDFNKTLRSFEETHVAGTRRVIDFCLNSKHTPQIFFVSTVATVEGWPALNPKGAFVPEQTFDDPAVTIPQGYSESKYVTEHMLRIAATRSAVPATVIRSGQMAGPTTKSGMWNKNEWLPSIVSTSKALGLIPSSLGDVDVVDWVPLDVAAEIVVDLCRARTLDLTWPHTSDDKSNAFDTFHLINPRTSSWSSLVPVLQEAFDDAKVVSFTDWVAALSKVPATKEEAEKKPGIKLLDFYQDMAAGHGSLPRLATVKTEGRSPAMQNLQAVNGDLMKNWLRQWGL